MKYELEVMWEDGTKAYYEYDTEAEAEQGKAYFEEKYGKEIWCRIRRRRWTPLPL